MLKRILYREPVRRTFCNINYFILGFFYDKRHLKGKFFEEKLMGWKWGWSCLKNRLIGDRKKIPWPINSSVYVHNAKNIIFDQSSINIFQSPGCYYQNFSGVIWIGSGVYIAPNVGVITSNHNVYDLDKHEEAKDVIIGDNCWIGMNSIILPGVILGDNTIVGAGSVVTKSFKDGKCVVAGNPAKIIRYL